jgi:uncharacterized membrane-anchored protein
MRSLLILTLVAAFGAWRLPADDAPPRPSADQLATLASSLHWQTGTITLKDGLATIKLTPDFRYLGPEDAEKVLHDIWGNPAGVPQLGMIFPADVGPLDPDGWGVVINYEENGYVKDNDADTINYPDLLKQMQQAVHDANADRQRDGYPAMELVGWAAPPHYDHATHKLYWAKNFSVSGNDENSLNYDVRILGRRGVLVLSAISAMRDYPRISSDMPNVIAMVDFQPGNLYSDFDPAVDKVAKYGLAALIAGGALGAAAKFGLLKFLWPLVLALKKFIILIAVAVAAGFKKLMAMFKGKSSEARPFQPPPSAGGAPVSIPAPRTPTTPPEGLRPPPGPGEFPPLRPPEE